MSKNRLIEQGFALPTVLIASVVMIIVMLSAITATVSINTAIDAQYYNKIATEAAQSGVVMAAACTEKDTTPQWTDATPLRPDSDCNGAAPACGDSVSGYVLDQPNTKTTFCVGAPELQPNGTYKVDIVSRAQQIRSSDNSVWKTFMSDARYIMTPSAAIPVELAKFDGGQSSLCAISTTSKLYCLGANTNYVLGTGSSDILFSTPTFNSLQGDLVGKTVSQASVNAVHGCAVASGAIYCWGGQQNGALGTNDSGNKPSPTAVVTSGALAGKTMTTVMTAGTSGLIGGATIYAHTCALDSTGAAYCWGANGNGLTGGGQLGNGVVGGGGSAVPVAVVGGMQFKQDQIDGGSWHTCAIRRLDNPLLSGDGWLYCWGADNNGQIGNGGSGGSTVTHTGTPTRVQGTKANIFDFEFQNAKFTQLSSGQAHNCAITTSNTMWCWGQNSQGQLGREDISGGSSQIAVKVPLPSGETGWSKVAAGTYWTCGLTLAGHAYCWGGSSLIGPSPYIGDGSTSHANRPSPTAVVTSGVLAGKTLTDIWCTFGTTIVRDTEGKYYAWGMNNDALLGTGVSNGPYAYSPVSATHLNTFALGGGGGGGTVAF